MHIPNYANKIAEKYIIERDCQLSVYTWFASKGYQTDFKQVLHLGIRAVNNTTGKRLIDNITTSKKTMSEWTKHWKKQFDLDVKI